MSKDNTTIADNLLSSASKSEMILPISQAACDDLSPQVVADNRSAVDENTKEPATSLLTVVKDWPFWIRLAILAVDSTDLCQDLTDWMSAMIDNKKWTNATPVFSAKKCRNPDECLTTLLLPLARKSTGGWASRSEPKNVPGLLGFSVIKTASNKHGTIDLVNGKFTVKLPGIYLLHFSGYYMMETSEDSESVQLRVNSRPVAQSSPRLSADQKKSVDKEDDDDEEEEPDSVDVSSFLRLETGDVVDCYSNELYLHEEREPYQQDTIESITRSNITTRFSAFYFPDE